MIFFGSTENTRLGWTMFEADRVMKGYSIGRDNLTREPVRSRIPGYRSVTSMTLADPAGDSGLWSRFWLVPEPITARLSDDGQSIHFEPIRIRVKTETMRWAGGRLVPAGGIRDVHAEAFANHFTRHYDAYAAENPIYAELKQVTASVAMAKWMKERGIPVNWNLNRIMEGAPFATPETTPAAFSEEEKTWSNGWSVRSLTIYSFGGVEMSPEFVSRAGRDGNAFRDAILSGWKRARSSGNDAFPVKIGGREVQAVALPGADQREVAGYALAENDLPRAAERLAGLPGLARSYSSLHNEPTEMGRSWSLLLPRLDFEDTGGKGSQFLTVEGDPATRVLVQRFVLTNAFGLSEVRFDESFVDQDLRRIGFKPVGSSAFRGLYPEGDGVYRLFFANNDQALFDRHGRLRAMLTPTTKALYEYDATGRLIALRYSSPSGEEEVHYTHDARGRLASMTAGGEQAFYDYDSAGNLARVRGSGGHVAYRYDSRSLLTSVILDGRAIVENRYDSFGRLVAQRDARGTSVTQQIEAERDGSRVVLFTEEGRIGKRHYDANLRLTKEETPGGTVRTYSYAGERIAAIDIATPNEAKARVELDERGNVTHVRGPRGVRVDVSYHPGGLPAQTRVNGRIWAKYGYDAFGRLTSTVYGDGSRESYEWDDAARIVTVRRTTPSGVTSSAKWPLDRNVPPLTASTNTARTVRRRDAAGVETTLHYDGSGLLESVHDASGARTSFTYDANRRLRQIRLPGGDCREYLYDAAGNRIERRRCGAAAAG